MIHIQGQQRVNSIDSFMSLPITQKALEIGLDPNLVRRTIEKQLNDFENFFLSTDALVDAALTLADGRTETDNKTPTPTDENKRIKTDRGSKSPQSKTEGVPRRNGKPIDLEEENRLLKEAWLCKICMDNEVGIVFLPCGHLAACTVCALSLEDCPLCRTVIKATVRTFLS